MFYMERLSIYSSKMLLKGINETKKKAKFSSFCVFSEVKEIFLRLLLKI